ncbi:hypothetical protein CFC21_108344 [Triticum aestivum]|uniref:Uncharacterized protein n=3 Tax=Triticinae TaxID=1648030 RepID=A0A453R7G9_AEGTS|nr:uncharacterized protein LOC109759819 [Aegilops tauschii subsp. strangulata]XP_044441469.1 uncharacterized protein LOC123167680 [Triticum aestivum]KAF7107758.1 hypothetical protein CFC21_108344 [Triticum aestivum]
MGNCQAAEEATVVVQHPGGGRVERLYWATSAAEVMRANPGHYVALVTLRVTEEEGQRQRRGAVRLTRVKLLKPRDTLQLGHAYRLIAVDEVTRAVQARKEEKTRRAQRQRQQASAGNDQSLMDEGLDQLEQQDRDGHPSSSTKGSRHRQWRPSLHSIAEVSS